MRRFLCTSWLILLLAACAAPPATAIPSPASPATPSPLPAATPTAAPPTDAGAWGELSGWRRDGKPWHYDREMLYDLVNGAADLYFSYGFEEVMVQEYVDQAGQSARAEVWRLTSDADAYGLYTYHSYGEPVDLGVDGEREAGYRLAFWQEKTFVQIVAREAVDDAALWALGQAIAASLPQGGARPALVGALPTQGLVPGSARFFREKIALDNLLWLGPDDLLGLGPDVEGVVARYVIGEQSADLLLVAYPDAARAEKGLAALEGGEVEGLVAAGLSERRIGAVFGSLPVKAAEDLLAEALESAG